MRHYSTVRRAERHGGFTLIELMMVIAIIAFLMAVTYVAVKNVLSGSRERATQATLRKIDGLLTRRIEAIERQFEREGGKYSSTDARGVRERKRAYLRLLPQTFGEADITPVISSKHNPETESAAVLYHFLTKAAALDTEDLDSDQFSEKEVADTDGDGLPEFIDAWGKPLRFYRWPTRLIRPAFNGAQKQEMNGASDGYAIPIDPTWIVLEPYGIGGASASIFFSAMPSGAGATIRGPLATWANELTDPLAKDADDPLGHTHPQSPQFTTLFGSIQKFEADFHTPETWSLPLIVSAGVDGEFGLFGPHERTMHGHLAQPQHELAPHVLDNLTNRNLSR